MLTRRFKLGTFFDVRLYVHWSFFLLPAFIAYREWSHGGQAIEVALTVLFVLLLFTCVILHEYGHVLAARAFGVGTRDITMLPIGGVARLERMPEEPWQELIVAIAGPAVNVMIAATLGLGMVVIGQFSLELQTGSSQFASQLFAVNVGLVIFNMIPAFPMDGGRVFRSVVSMFTNHRRATWWAMRLGQVMAICLGIFGLTMDLVVLPFIAAFIFWVGMMEYRQVDIASRTKDLFVRDAMIRSFMVASVHDDLTDFAQRAADQLQQVFPVVEDGIYRGAMKQSQLVDAVLQPLAGQTASDIMRWDAITVDEDEPLQDVLTSLPRGTTQIPVLNTDNQVVGLLDAESCLRRTALRRSNQDQNSQPGERIDFYSAGPVD